MVSVNQSVEGLAGETDVLGEDQPQCRFVHLKYKYRLTWALTRTAAVEVGDYPPKF
jgi:hypothetical protein